MSTQLKFKNGHAYSAISIVSEGTQFIQGQNRPCIDAQFPADQFDKIRAEIAIPGNLDTLTVMQESTNDKGEVIDHNEWIHGHYNIVQRIGIGSYLVSAATDTAPEVTESRTSLLLAQLTYMEVVQKEQADKQAQSDQAIAELSALIAGGIK